MDFSDVFTTPKRPRLEFGISLDKVCENGKLHPALKDLFLKAYLNVKQDPLNDENNEYHSKSMSRAVLALQSGLEGQGTLSQRMHLKSKLESGEWVIPARTPLGAPLWLLRHFLGRLPRPLLKGAHWRAASRACATSILSSPDVGRVVQRLAEMIRSLTQAELEVSALLTLLLRKLSTRWDRQLGEEVHDSDSLSALTQYFIASITTRPFRPGLYTSADRELQPLLMFLSRYWRVIFQGVQIGKLRRGNSSSSPIRGLAIRHCESAPEIRRADGADLDELHFCDLHRLRETSDGHGNLAEVEEVEVDRRANFIGFETLMFRHGRKPSNGTSDGFLTREEKEIMQFTRMDKNDPTTDRSRDLRRFRIELFLEDSILETEASPLEDLDGKFLVESPNTQNDTNRSFEEECLIHSTARSTTSRETLKKMSKDVRDIDQHPTLGNCKESSPFKTLENNLIKQSDHLLDVENLVISECEYLSVRDSEAS